jgi:demethylphylloquinol methyltransferase
MPTADQADRVQSLFDRIAPVYDDLNDTLSLGQHKIWKLMAVKWCAPQPGDVGLDLCCGSGDVAVLLADRVGSCGQVYGVDFAIEQLKIAQQRRPDVHWVQANVLQLPFHEAHFDCATMSYGLRNVSDIPASLAELYRVLKPGAKAAILDMHRPENVWVRGFQEWYLDNVVVPAAQRLGFTDEYAYIAPSLDQFPIGSEQVRIAQQVGFHAIHYPIAAGTMGVLVVTKPSA